MKHIKRNSIIVLILTIVVLFLVLKDNFLLTMQTIFSVNIWYIFLAILFIVISFFIDTYSLHLITKMYNKNIKLSSVLRINIITKFFNGITPLASGGQPMEVYELHKKDISYANSISICTQSYIVFQISLMFIATFSIIVNNFFYRFFVERPILKELTIFGYVSNLIILIFLFIIAFNKKFNRFIVRKIIGFLYKIRIIKNKEEQINKWDLRCDEFYQAGLVLRNNKSVFVKGVLLQLFSLIFIYLVPMFIIFATKSSINANILNTIVASSYAFMAGCFVPIPGGSGGMEYGFVGFFSNLAVDSFIGSILIIWRFLTYYLQLIVGAIVFNIKEKK